MHRHGVGIDRAEIEIKASSLAPEHAALLGVTPGSPSLVIIRRYFDASGEPFEVTVTHHPEHRFTFNMELRSVSRSFTK
jgi:DNA-binding GntR family transcriptional regulator